MGLFKGGIFGLALALCVSCGININSQNEEPVKPTPTPVPGPTVPKNIDLEGKIDGEVSLKELGGGVGSNRVYILKGTATNVTSSEELPAQLHFQGTNEREYVSPSLGDCKLDLQTIAMKPDRKTITFEFWTGSESDEAAPPSCRLFANRVCESGFEVKLSNVPTYGGKGTIPSVTLKLTK